MEKNSQFKSLDYWNERYKTEDHYEWFGDYSKFKDVIHSLVRPTDKILTLGCGNSRMSEELYLDNFTNIVNTDYSPILIDAMRKKYSSLDKMSWLVMDINNLKFEEKSFDCVIEKGTLDALLVDEKDPWNMSQENLVKMENILEQISRILKNGGVFISITFAQPHFRKPLYAHDKFNWSIKQFTIGDAFHYFIYVMKKGETLSDFDKELNSRKEISDFKIRPVELEETNPLAIQVD